jgi:hypothetical protein
VTFVGQKKMVAQWNQGHVCHAHVHHWSMYEVDGRRLFFPPQVMSTINIIKNSIKQPCLMENGDLGLHDYLSAHTHMHTYKMCNQFKT